MSGAPRLLVADSFRVRRHPESGQAQVRGWSRHLERFSRAVTETSQAELSSGDLPTITPGEPPTNTALQAFLEDAAQRIAAYGTGFPRLEFWRDADTSRFSLNLRPLPPLGDTLEMRTAPGITLDQAGRKGPNIERLRDLNVALGAEALLLDPAGNALEGATTSLVWWEQDSDTPHIVASPLATARGEAANRVPSVTESLMTGAFHGSKTAFVPGLVTPGRLLTAEVWAVNALHGIRVVTTIDGQATRPSVRARLEQHRAELDHTWKDVFPLLPAER